MDTPLMTDRAGSRAGTAVGGQKTRVAVAGATGFAGQELLRWMAGHPHAQITAAMSSSPDGPPRSLPALAKIWDGVIEPFSADKLADVAEVVFLALPEEAAATIAPTLVERGVRVIDLSGAFRLRDAALREKWYPATKIGSLKPVYGLTERNYAEIAGARLLTNPGCYPTAALLALEPLAEAGLLAFRAPAKNRATGRTSPRITAACRPTASLAIGISRKSSKSWARRSPSSPIWCRSIGEFSKRFTAKSAQAPRRTMSPPSWRPRTEPRHSCG
jgi:hypothetical protein